jgi:hypothetical protein
MPQFTSTRRKIDIGQIVPIKWEYIAETPTTLAGYGITDAYTINQLNNTFLRVDEEQLLTLDQRLQALENLGIADIEAMNLTQGTGIILTPNPITSVGQISFNVAWGDNRYHNRLNIINNASQFEFLGNVEGIQVRANTSGSTGFPSSLGSSIAIYTGSNNTASAMARTLALFRTYNTESYYLGSSTAGGATNPWRLIWHNGNLDPVTRTTEQTITGLKYIRRGGNAGAGEITLWGFDHPDNNGTDYNLRLYSNAAGNNVRQYFRQKVVVGTNNVSDNFPVLGFKNWITLIGTDDYPFTEIATYYNAQTNPTVRHPLRMYTDGDAMFKGKVLAGKDNFTDIGFLDGDDTLYSEGTTYAKKGFRTPNPRNESVLDFSKWFLGEYEADATHTKTHNIYIKVDDKIFKLSAEEVVSIE